MSIVLHRTKSDRVADTVIYAGMGLFALLTLFPIYYVFVVSITPFSEVLRNGGFLVIPRTVSWDAYTTIFGSPVVPRALQVTATITVLGTAANLAVTLLTAYPLSKKGLRGRNAVLLGIVFTMLFSGGLIPTYLTVRSLGLLNSLWALILPGLISTFNMLIVKTYFENLPAEVEEAAKVDGCSDWQTLMRIVLPLSKPVIATVGLFYAIQHWNSYYGALLYITDKKLYPIQVVLRNMIRTDSISNELATQFTQIQTLPPETVKMATVCVAVIPLLLVYPFLQRFFLQGVTLGAVKG